MTDNVQTMADLIRRSGRLAGELFAQALLDGWYSRAKHVWDGDYIRIETIEAYMLRNHQERRRAIFATVKPNATFEQMFKKAFKL